MAGETNRAQHRDRNCQVRLKRWEKDLNLLNVALWSERKEQRDDCVGISFVL